MFRVRVIGEFLRKIRTGFSERAQLSESLLQVTELSTDRFYQVVFDPPMSMDLSVEEQVEWLLEHGRFGYGNQSLADQYGLAKSKDVRGHLLRDVVPPSDPATRPMLSQFARKRFQVNSIVSQEEGADGKITWEENQGFGVIVDNQLVEFWGIARDVTELIRERRKAELRGAGLDSVNEGCLIVDNTLDDHPIVYANSSFLRISGYELEEVLGKNARFMQGPDSDQQTIDQMQKAISRNAPCEVELLNYRKNGEPFWNQISISPLRDDMGKVSHFVGIMTDVTARRVRRRALRRSARILDTTHDCVFSTDLAGVITDWNHSAGVLFGYEEQEAIGLPLSVIFPEERWTIARGVLGETISEKKRIELTSPCVTRSGQTVVMEMRFTPELNRSGESVGCVVCGSDVTATQRLTNRIQELNSEMAHVGRIAAINELSSSIAHELNQPIAASMANAQTGLKLLQSPEIDREMLREILEDVVHDSLRSGAIVNRLRKSVKKAPHRQEKTDLSGLAEETVALMRSEFLIKGIAVSDKLADGLPPVEVDPVQVQQVILNLLKNAVEAIDQDNSDERCIDICTCATGDLQVVVEVVDSGPGIGEAQLETLIEPFYTTKPEGLGLGLGICQSILRTHGGSMEIGTDASGRTSFRCILPAVPTED